MMRRRESNKRRCAGKRGVRRSREEKEGRREGIGNHTSPRIEVDYW